MSMLWLLPLSLGGAILLFFHGYVMRRNAVTTLKSALEAGLAPVNAPAAQARGLVAQVVRAARRYAPLANRFPRLRVLLLPADLDQRLGWAGNPLGLASSEFIGVQLLFMLLAGLAGLWVEALWFGFSSLTLAAGCIGLLSGGPLALRWLEWLANARQHELTRMLPDALEIICASVTAGLDIDRAIALTTAQLSGPLQEEFGRFLNELQFGASRPDAYSNLLWRNRSNELQIIVGALRQGHALGVPVTQTLSTQVEAMRERRLQRAKEEGSKIPTNIILIMMIFILPSVFIMFIVVFGYSIWRDMAPMFQSF